MSNMERGLFVIGIAAVCVTLFRRPDRAQVQCVFFALVPFILGAAWVVGGLS